MVVMFQIVKAIHQIYYLYIGLQMLTRMILKQSTFYEVENSTPLVGLEPTIVYIPSSINSRHASDHQSNASQIYFYILGAPKQEIVYGNVKIMNCRCLMTAILNFTISGKTVPFIAWHTAEMNSSQKMHIETTNEVLFLKNAYRSLPRAIFQFLVLTNWGSLSTSEIWKVAHCFGALNCDRCTEICDISHIYRKVIWLHS